MLEATNLVITGNCAYLKTQIAEGVFYIRLGTAYEQDGKTLKEGFYQLTYMTYPMGKEDEVPVVANKVAFTCRFNLYVSEFGGIVEDTPYSIQWHSFNRHNVQGYPVPDVPPGAKEKVIKAIKEHAASIPSELLRRLAIFDHRERLCSDFPRVNREIKKLKEELAKVRAQREEMKSELKLNTMLVEEIIDQESNRRTIIFEKSGYGVGDDVAHVCKIDINEGLH